MVTNLLSSLAATAAVVPEPPKKSSTVSPGLELAEIILRRIPSGFWVGYPCLLYTSDAADE